MAYINFEVLSSSQVTTKEYIILQICKQMKFEDLSEELIDACGESEVESLLKLEDKGLTHFIKGNPKDTFFQRARLTPRGTKFMDKVEMALVNEDDELIWDWLVKIYKKLDKSIGTESKGKKNLASFRVHSGINKNKLAYLCRAFISDEARMEWSFQLEYLFWKPSNIHQVRFSLDDSKLWKYYLDNKEMFDREFERIDLKDAAKS